MGSDSEKKAEEQKESFQIPGVAFAAIVVALFGYVIVSSDLTSPAGIQALSAPHVVPPPPGAKDTDISVQFCQA